MNDLGDANVVGMLIAVISVISMIGIGNVWRIGLDRQERLISEMASAGLITMSVLNISLLTYIYLTTRHIQFVLNPTHTEIVLAIIEGCVSALTIIVATSFWVHVVRQPWPVR